jgi:hypothetical protein
MSHGSKIHRAYLAASPADKKIILDKLEARHYQRAASDLELPPESLGHAYYDALIHNDLNHEMDAEGRAEQARLERYSNAKLNNSYLRTSEQLAAAEQQGNAIIASPETALAALTFSQSVFDEPTLQRYLLTNTANATQYDAAMRAVLAHPGLVVQHDAEKGLLFTTAEIVEIEQRLVERTNRLAGNLVPTREELEAALADPAYRAEEARRDAAAEHLRKSKTKNHCSKKRCAREA